MKFYFNEWAQYEFLWLKVKLVAEVTDIACTKDDAPSTESKTGRVTLRLWSSAMWPPCGLIDSTMVRAGRNWNQHDFGCGTFYAASIPIPFLKWKLIYTILLFTLWPLTVSSVNMLCNRNLNWTVLWINNTSYSCHSIRSFVSSIVTIFWGGKWGGRICCHVGWHLGFHWSLPWNLLRPSSGYFSHEGGGCRFLWNIDSYLPGNMLSLPEVCNLDTTLRTWTLAEVCCIIYYWHYSLRCFLMKCIT